MIHEQSNMYQLKYYLIFFGLLGTIHLDSYLCLDGKHRTDGARVLPVFGYFPYKAGLHFFMLISGSEPGTSVKQMHFSLNGKDKGMMRTGSEIGWEIRLVPCPLWRNGETRHTFGAHGINFWD